jgi:S1-C subfamily serine protease/pSer/pThr/pTyr-binding forkhead associated (FHA) protein
MQLKITSGANAGQTVEVSGNEFTIGREPGVDLVINDGKASRKHAALKPLPDGRATLYDLGSSNGTFVNGQRIQSTVLNGNEQIQIGDTVMIPVVQAAAPAGAAGGATSVGAAPPAAQQPTPPPQQQYTPPTQQQPAAQPQAAFQAPSPQPIQRPSRTQSAIQRIMLQRAVTRATWVAIAAILLVVGIGVAALLGAFAGETGKTTLSNAEIVEKVKPSTFFIVTDKDFANGGGGGRGTGWVWDAQQGLIVTNAHVVAGGVRWSVGSGDHLRIEVADDRALTATPNGRPAELIGQANCEDIAVLKVSDTTGLKTLPRSSQASVRLGDHVVAVGYPSTLNITEDTNFDQAGVTAGDLTANSGDVSQVETTFGAIPGEGSDPTVGPYNNVILTDTVINQGNSGGPLVDEEGRLVGINSATRTDVQGQNYAIGVDRVNEIVPKLLAGEDVCEDGNGALWGDAPEAAPVGGT